MFNPPIYPNPNSYEDVLQRMKRRMQENGVDDRLVAILQEVFEKELEHGVVLSRPDRGRLFREVSKNILTEVMSKVDGAK